MHYQKSLGLVFILSVLIMTFITPQSAQAAAYTVTPLSLAPCGILRENPAMAAITLGSGLDLVVGPAGAPAGVGSLQAIVPGATDGFALICGDASYLGARLDSFTTFSYSTYTDNIAATFSLFINIDYNVADANTGWQGRLTFEPYQSFTVTPNTWQTWDALAGEWWASGAPGNGVCPQMNPCTLAEVLAAFPNAGIHPTLGAIGHKAGSGWTGVTTYVDNLRFATSGGINDTYDYEPNVPTLTLTKSAPATVIEAEIFNYSLLLNNTSTLASANNIVVEDILPAGVTYVSDDQGCSEAANTVTCNIATLAISSSLTINITVQTIGVSGDILSNAATVDADELVAPQSSNTTNTGINVVPPVVVVPVAPSVPVVQVPAPPQCNEPNGDIVGYGLPDGIYCRTLFADGGWRVTAGAIPVELVIAGAIRAVDIYRVTGGNVVNGEFGGGVPVCLAGIGRMVFLDASTSPRAQVDINSFVDGNFTCAFLTHSGTVVLMP